MTSAVAHDFPGYALRAAAGEEVDVPERWAPFLKIIQSVLEPVLSPDELVAQFEAPAPKPTKAERKAAAKAAAEQAEADEAAAADAEMAASDAAADADHADAEKAATPTDKA